jgi:hypothetical protein
MIRAYIHMKDRKEPITAFLSVLGDVVWTDTFVRVNGSVSTLFFNRDVVHLVEVIDDEHSSRT